MSEFPGFCFVFLKNFLITWYIKIPKTEIKINETM